MKSIALLSAALLTLGGCGSAGPVPEQFIASWGNDCAHPFMAFTPQGTMHIYAVGTDYKIQSASLANNVLTVTYADPDAGATMTDTYAVEGDGLRQTRATSDKGADAEFTGSAYKRCS